MVYVTDGKPKIRNINGKLIEIQNRCALPILKFEHFKYVHRDNSYRKPKFMLTTAQSHTFALLKVCSISSNIRKSFQLRK